jgi:hypothetical protein
MESVSSCEQCNSIARDLNRAYSEAWQGGSAQTQSTWAEFYRLIVGTDAEFEQAQARMPMAGARSQARINDALGKKFYHQSRTGHKVPWSFRIWMEMR